MKLDPGIHLGKGTLAQYLVTIALNQVIFDPNKSLWNFTNSLQYKNANIADFLLDVLLKINSSNKICIYEM